MPGDVSATQKYGIADFGIAQLARPDGIVGILTADQAQRDPQAPVVRVVADHVAISGRLTTRLSFLSTWLEQLGGDPPSSPHAAVSTEASADLRLPQPRRHRQIVDVARP
ncbi:hypothetical protein [Actinomadura miaoliensis]|uniref:Uncharacterized protein n=1 Tax=Actinomadura miaoliensis TaxID=430685 RepID=A0ABP7VKC9_9ACTN